MGNDYKRKSNETFERGRRIQVDKMSDPELPTKPLKTTRTLVTLFDPETQIAVGDICDIVSEGAGLKFIRGGHQVGIMKKAPSSVVEIVNQAGGCVPGHIVHYQSPHMPCRVSIDISK